MAPRPPAITLHKSLRQNREAAYPQKGPDKLGVILLGGFPVSPQSTAVRHLENGLWERNISSSRPGHQNDTPGVRSRLRACPASWSSSGEHFTRRRDSSYDPEMLASVQNAAFLGKQSHSVADFKPPIRPPKQGVES